MSEGWFDTNYYKGFKKRNLVVPHFLNPFVSIEEYDAITLQTK